MSAYAVNPETHAVWRYLETDNEELYEREEAEMARGEEELGLLLAGTNYFFFHSSRVEHSLIFLTVFKLPTATADLEGSPTVAKLELYVKRLFELQCFTQRSLARKLERYQREDVCLAGLEARPGAYLCSSTEEDIQRHMDMEELVAQREEKDGELARLAAQVEQGQRSYAENVHCLDVVNGLIAKRRAREQLELDDEEEECSGSEWDEHESGQEAHEGEQSIRTKLDHLTLHE
jgi:hypothetical protein